MDRSFKQGESATHLVEERIDTMQACLVVEPSLVIFVVVTQIGEVGHGSLARSLSGTDGQATDPAIFRAMSCRPDAL